MATESPGSVRDLTARLEGSIEARKRERDTTLMASVISATIKDSERLMEVARKTAGEDVQRKKKPRTPGRASVSSKEKPGPKWGANLAAAAAPGSIPIPKTVWGQLHPSGKTVPPPPPHPKVVVQRSAP